MINERDTLTLYLKKDKAKEIIKNYQLFGWRVESQSDNKRYEDILDVSLSREHNIENKDELQLYQVYMEERYNELGKLKRNKHARAAAFGLSIGVIGVALFVLGILFSVGVMNFNSLTLSIAMALFGLVLIIICVIFLPKIIKKEKNNYLINKNKLNNEIKLILEKVLSLNGGKKNEK